MSESQEIIKVISSINGTICIVVGIIALFRGVKAEGEVDIQALFKGKIKTGSAGIILLFIGALLITVPVLKGKKIENSLELYKSQEIEKYIEEFRIFRSREFL